MKLLPAFIGEPEKNKIYNTDALTFLRSLRDKSVHAFITDLPYGTTAEAWDEVIPFAPMWAEVKRTLKPRGVFVTTASQPFTSKLVMSNLEWFKYALVWEKNRPTGFLHAKDKPLKSHEDVLVFCESFGSYYPQGLKAIKPVNNGRGRNKLGKLHDGGTPGAEAIQTIGNYPRSIMQFDSSYDRLHPTQKPIELLEYLIRTYTQPGELVVDFCCGSGTTCVAAANLQRSFIGNDLTFEYVVVSRDRLTTEFGSRSQKVGEPIHDLPLFSVQA